MQRSPPFPSLTMLMRSSPNSASCLVHNQHNSTQRSATRRNAASRDSSRLSYPSGHRRTCGHNSSSSPGTPKYCLADPQTQQQHCRRSSARLRPSAPGYASLPTRIYLALCHRPEHILVRMCRHRHFDSFMMHAYARSLPPPIVRMIMEPATLPG